MRDRKALLLVAHGLAPETFGGVEVYTRNLYEAFKQSRKIDPFVLTRTLKNKYQGVVFGDEVDTNLFYIQSPQMDASFLRSERSLEYGFKDFLISLRPDIVHFQHYLHLSMEWFKAVREVLPGARILLTLHEYMLLCPHNGQMIKTRSSGKGSKDGHLCRDVFSEACAKCFPRHPGPVFSERRDYVKECLKAVDLFTAPSNFLRNIMIEKLGIPSEKIIFSENGQAVFRPSAREKPGPGGLTLGFMGQINPYKGLHVLLDALAKMKGTHDISLKIFGVCNAASDEHYFSHQIKSRLRGLKQAEYCGPYAREQLPDILAEIDLLVVPSVWWENSPLVIQEAFMAKVPVICSNIGGMAEKVTDGVNGLHFAVNDSEDLSKKIMDVYKNKGKLDFFKKNIPAVKTISDNRFELESIYLSL